MYTASNADALFGWYKKNGRNLPWRETKEPYPIWLSEVMLQQTQVMKVIPYYHRWLIRFPTLASVAEAEPESLLKVWEGLGYYQRCHNFRQAAVLVRDRYRGVIPSDYERFRALPGVGEYTAAAVLSMAFGKPLPVMDGNVKRVLARYLGMRKLSPVNLRRMHAFLRKQISHERPGLFNQAMMELGARICRPRSPFCEQCPLAGSCRALARGKVESYPRKTARKPVPHYEVVIGLLWRKNHFLITRRKANGHLGGLWELPGGKIESGEAPESALRREFLEECRTSIAVGSPVGAVKHTYSHFSIHLQLYHCYPHNSAAILPVQSHRWIKPEEIDRYPFPAANHKLFALCREQDWRHD
ncbi:MAG: A/G-specific adenine glycosylase [Fidelibacterota bacterium]